MESWYLRMEDLQFQRPKFKDLHVTTSGEGRAGKQCDACVGFGSGLPQVLLSAFHITVSPETAVIS